MAALAAVAVAAVVSALVGFGSSGATTAAAASSPSRSSTAMAGTKVSSLDKGAALHTAMRTLWADHMHWTYATVDAFFHEPNELTPKLDRLLANQREIGDAIKPYYGKAAGNKLGDLLTTHIKDAVPVLKAAQAGDKAGLKKALDVWYANAKQIAVFLAKANPNNWPKSVTEPALKMHITQTTAYSVDLLKGHYTASIKHFDKALRHMMMLSDILAGGIIAQFPNKF